MKLYQVITADSLVINFKASSLTALHKQLIDENIKPIIITIVG